MKIATWNVNSLRVRLPHLLQWMAEAEPDVVCLQETKVTDGQFPVKELRDAGYPHVAFMGQKTYNGVAILSRHPLQDVQLGFANGDPDPQKRLVMATINGVRVVNCYVPNGHRVGSDKFDYKLDWLERLREELDDTVSKTQDLLVCGDMNVAMADIDTYDPFETEGHLLHTDDERDTLKYLLEWGLTDSWRTTHPYSAEYSWWDYRAGGWQRNHGFRIDYVFLSGGLMERLEGAAIHRHVRGWDQPSDHVPVMVTLR